MVNLADRFIHQQSRWNSHLHPKTFDQIKYGVRNARKFVFSEEATARLAKVVNDIPDLIAREHEFARTPFDLMWIELPTHVYWNTLCELNRNTYAQHAEQWYTDPNTADHTVGFLIDHYRVNTLVGGTVAQPKGPVLISPVQYQLHTEWELQEQVAFVERHRISRLTMMQFMWGSSYNRLSSEQRRTLHDNNVVEFLPMRADVVDRIDLNEVAVGGCGDLRTIVAILLMLNRPLATSYRPVPTGRGWHRSKPIPFMSHTVIDVSLDATHTLQLVGTSAGDSVERRWHEVRDHYCHDKTARDYMRIAGCVHDWMCADEDWRPTDALTLDVTHWVCASCGGKRWRRVYKNGRGTAQRGLVVHDEYSVGI